MDLSLARAHGAAQWVVDRADGAALGETSCSPAGACSKTLNVPTSLHFRSGIRLIWGVVLPTPAVERHQWLPHEVTLPLLAVMA
jgi:hypothetical protein